MSRIELLDGCDVLYSIRKSDVGVEDGWYPLGYVASTSTNDGRNISERGEVGSNATVLLVDESQRSMSMQRLNVARKRGTAPYNKNLPAMIKWILLDGSNSPEKILIDLDSPAFNIPFDIKKEYFSQSRETGAPEVKIAEVIYKYCKITQMGLAVGAGAKYMDDGLGISWEETVNNI